MDHRFDVLVTHFRGSIESPLERLVVMTGSFQVHPNMYPAHDNVPRVKGSTNRNFPFDIRLSARCQSTTGKSTHRDRRRFCRYVLLTVAVGHAMIGQSEHRRQGIPDSWRRAATAQAGGSRMTVHRETMTSRERLLMALNHQEPDRIPIDLGGNQTGIHRLAYAALLERLGWHEDIAIMDAVQQLARPSEAVLSVCTSTRGTSMRVLLLICAVLSRPAAMATWHDLVDEFESAGPCRKTRCHGHHAPSVGRCHHRGCQGLPFPRR
jgi:hypothetical protein